MIRVGSCSILSNSEVSVQALKMITMESVTHMEGGIFYQCRRGRTLTLAGTKYLILIGKGVIHSCDKGN